MCRNPKVMKIFFALIFLILLTLPTKLKAQILEPDTIQETNKKMVSVPVSVSDREGHYISGLKKEDFSVYQDNVKQKITFFDAYNEPVNMALLIDTSGSTRDVIKKIKDAARDFIELLNSKDRCLVATFDSEVKIISPFTSNHEALKSSLHKIEPPEQGATFMYTAVRQIAQNSFADVDGRKVIILLSDGKDFGSSVTKDELLNQLEESDVLIYTIFYKTDPTQNPGQKRKKYRKRKKDSSVSIPTAQVAYVPTEAEVELLEKNVEIEAIDSLKKMSETTAGRFYASDLPNLKKIFRQITGELTQQYRLGYRLKDAANGTIAHDINVKVDRSDVVVHTRRKFRNKQS